jgi:hypothetical protein
LASASAAPGQGWAPTDEWFEGVKRALPLGTLMGLISHLAPLVEEHIGGHGGTVDDEDVVAFLRATTVVGILPVPHPIM